VPFDDSIEATVIRDDGFTVLELLIALTVTLLLASAMASAAPAARQAFDRVPAELDLQQRGRSAIESLSQMLRSATSISEPGDSATLTVMAPIAHGGQAVLAADQFGMMLILAPSWCPNLGVCGFTAGTTAVITDGLGRDDVFIVSATDAALRRLTPDRVFASAYPAGSAIVEIDQYTYRLAPQADGSYSLIRETAAGAIQPMVDFVRDLSFTVTSSQVDISLRVEAATEPLRRLLPDRVFKTSVRVRNRS
jgi:prepilin-type N-terminal cleavage/methylation domain-containing protein